MWIRNERTGKEVRVFLSFFALFLLGTFLFAKERSRAVGIALVTVGKLDDPVVDRLREDLARTFKRQILMRKQMPGPDYAFNNRTFARLK